MTANLAPSVSKPGNFFFPSPRKNLFDFSINPSTIASKAASFMKDAKEVNDRIASLAKSEVSLATVLEPLKCADYEGYVRVTQLEFLQHVSEDEKIREASCDADKAISEFSVGESMRVDVFQRVQWLSEFLTDEDPETKRYVERMIRDGRRSGLHLASETRQRIEGLKKKLSELAITFNFNISQENTVLWFTRSELDGLQDDLIDSLEKRPGTTESEYKLTLKSPHYVPVMKNCKIQATRKAMEKAYNSRCMDVNLPVLEEILKTRAELATTLGYPTHADFVTETRMSKTSSAVQEFLVKLQAKVTESGRAEKELQAMLEIRQSQTGEPTSSPLAAYDVSFYRNLMLEKQFAVDHVEIQKYFPFEHVTKEMLSIYETILGIKFEQVFDQPKWHEDVVCYAVKDATDSHMIGYFYMDMFPREGKYSHAALFPLQPSAEYAGERGIGICSLVCNFTKPTPTKPSTLTHDEVTTYFHEFGHCMHHICAEKPKFSSFSGTNVERDFVECPSQMLENWTWEPEILARLGKHFSTGEPLPMEMITALVNSRIGDEGMSTLKQLTYATFDQFIHSRSDGESVAVTYARVHKELTGLAVTPGTAMPASFGHLCGYDGQYYGYLWAEVFSADCFYSRFRGHLLDKDVGASYRKEILSYGGSRDGEEMLRGFLGRDPDMEAFLILKGMK